MDKEPRAPPWHERYNWDMLAWLATIMVVVAFAQLAAVAP